MANPAALRKAQASGPDPHLQAYHDAIAQGKPNADIVAAFKAYAAAHNNQHPPQNSGWDSKQRTRHWRARKTFELGRPPTVVNAGIYGGKGARAGSPAAGTTKPPHVPRVPHVAPAGAAPIPRPPKGFLDLDEHKIQHPGIRGGKGYWNVHGLWVYGDPPHGRPSHPLPPKNLLEHDGYFSNTGLFNRSSSYNPRDPSKAGQAGVQPGSWYDAYGFMHFSPHEPPDPNEPAPIDWQSMAPAGYETRQKGHFNDEGYFDPQGVKRRPDLADTFGFVKDVPCWYDDLGFAHFHSKAMPAPDPNVCAGCGKSVDQSEIRYAKDLGYVWPHCTTCSNRQDLPHPDRDQMSDDQFDRFIFARAAADFKLETSSCNTQVDVPAPVIAEVFASAAASYQRPSHRYAKGHRSKDINEIIDRSLWARGGFIAQFGLEMMRSNVGAFATNASVATKYPDMDQRSAAMARMLIRTKTDQLHQKYPKFTNVYGWANKVQYELGALHLPEYRAQCDAYRINQDVDGLRKFQKASGRVAVPTQKILDATASDLFSYADFLPDASTLAAQFAFMSNAPTSVGRLSYAEKEAIAKGIGTTKTWTQMIEEFTEATIGQAYSDLRLSDQSFMASDPEEYQRRIKALDYFADQALENYRLHITNHPLLQGIREAWSNDTVLEMCSRQGVATPNDFEKTYLGGLFPGDHAFSLVQTIQDAAANQVSAWKTSCATMLKNVAPLVKKIAGKWRQLFNARCDIDVTGIKDGTYAEQYLRELLSRHDTAQPKAKVFGGARKLKNVTARIKKDVVDFIDRTTNFSGHNHRIIVHDVVAIEYDHPQYEATAAKIGNVQQLIHGAPPQVATSILRAGLQTREDTRTAGLTVRVTSQMLGDGIYFADQSTKASSYGLDTTWQQSLGSSNVGRVGTMYVCDVALGKVREAIQSDSSNSPANWRQQQRTAHPSQKYDSIKASRGSRVNPSGQKNDEYVTYDPNNIKMKYLVIFSKTN